MLVTPKVREILQQTDATISAAERDKLLAELVREVSKNTGNENSPDATVWQPGVQYPVDAEGYAVAFDPVTQEKEFIEHGQRYGIVVGKDVVPAALLDKARQRMRQIVEQLSGGKCDITDSATYSSLPADSAGAPFVSRGFLELYHDAIMAELRQSPRMYLHNALIWQRADLWTSFDRLGLKMTDSEDAVGLPLHVDQNPLVHPGFKTVQGVLALDDCPLERGTYVGVPTSRALFPEYAAHATNTGEYVELPVGSNLHQQVAGQAQAIPLRKGCLVSWDSRTTHGNSTNLSDTARYVMYVAAGPCRENEPELVKAREDAYKSGEGSNVREALMHASKRPRYNNPEALAALRQPEQLSRLGKLLYGFEKYSALLDAPAA